MIVILGGRCYGEEEGLLVMKFSTDCDLVSVTLMLDIKETDAIVAGLDGSPPAGQGVKLFDKLGKMRCARTRSINFNA